MATTLSRDPSVAEKTVDDPLCDQDEHRALRRPQALAEQARVRAICAGGFGIPTLVLHGEDDGLVPASASEILATAPLVERRTYPGLRHELHNEPEGPAVIDDVVAWLGRAIGRRARRARRPIRRGQAPIGWVAGGLVTAGLRRLAERPPGQQQHGAEAEQAGDRPNERDDARRPAGHQADDRGEVRSLEAARLVPR